MRANLIEAWAAWLSQTRGGELMRILIILLACLQLAYGCAAYGVYDDKRLMDTMADDKTTATEIKTSLMKAHLGSAFSVSVYCFYGNVFLVGEAPLDVRARAMEIARAAHPRSITPHWFAPAKSERSNLALAADLRAALIGAKGLSSTRIETEVNAGRVLLLGVVHDEAEKQLAIKTARAVKGVVSVTSYLLLPQKPVKK